jgi:hypothetical protein
MICINIHPNRDITEKAYNHDHFEVSQWFRPSEGFFLSSQKQVKYINNDEIGQNLNTAYHAPPEGKIEYKIKDGQIVGINIHGSDLSKDMVQNDDDWV